MSTEIGIGGLLDAGSVQTGKSELPLVDSVPVVTNPDLNQLFFVAVVVDAEVLE